MTKALATLLVVLVAFPPAAAAQSRNTAPFDTAPGHSARGRWDRADGVPLAKVMLEAGIDRDTEVTITLRNQSIVTGRVDYVGAQSLFVRESNTGNLTQIAYPKMAKLEELIPDGTATKIVMLTTLAALIYVVAVTR